MQPDRHAREQRPPGRGEGAGLGGASVRAVSTARRAACALGLALLCLTAPGGALAQGLLDNVATATGRGLGGVSVQGRGRARVNVVGPAGALSMSCSASLEDRGPPGTSAGDVITARISVTNEGGTALDDVVVEVEGSARPLILGDDGDLRLELGETWVYGGDGTVSQADIDTNGGGTGFVQLDGTASAAGVGTVPFTCDVPITRLPGLSIQKTVDTSLLAESPPRLRYRIVVSNSGNTTLRDVFVTDAKFTPATTVCDAIPVGGSCVREEIYVPTAAEVSDNLVRNTASARTNDIVGLMEADAQNTVTLYEPGDLQLTKSGSPNEVRRGDVVTYTVTVSNASSLQRTNLRILDQLPPGLALRRGTATVNGQRVPEDVNGQRILIGPFAVPANGSAVVTFQATVTANASPGTLINTARAVDARERTLAQADGRVRIASEPVLDCSDIIGRVFEDLNRNGVQDEGEPGLPGSRVVTARGLVVTADQFGRFSIPCFSVPRRDIGSNAVFKLDEASLPRGTRVVTENPRVLRLTPGRVARLSFGVARLRDVEVRITGSAFVAGRTDLDPAFRSQLDTLIRVLRDDPGVLRLTYRGTPGEGQRANLRLEALERTIMRLWQRNGSPYELQIERRVITP